MATIRYKGKTTVTTPTRSRGTSGSDASSARIAASRAASGKTSSKDISGENAAQRKVRLGITDLPGGGVTEADPTKAVPSVDSIDTSQPSPTTVQAGAGLPGAPQPTTVAPSPTAVKPAVAGQPSPYQQGHAQLAGTPAPQDAGQAMLQAKGALPPALPDMSDTDALLMEDKGWQSLLQAKEEYFNPDQQKTSLMDTYNKLYKKSGLDQLDEEIIDAKTVIEGTEDDIRNEIEQAGGFGTDSQVQALALSRNKVLLKNYNNLVALRESKAEHLGTMMSLAEKDRAYADSQFDRMLNFDMQMLNYRDKFIQNARDQYNKYTPQQLTAMLAGNPRQLAFAEQILGVGHGGIAKLANAPLSEAEQLDIDYRKEQILNMKAQRADIYSGIAARNADNTVMVDQNGKVLLPQKEAMKINKEVSNTDAYKAITKGKDSLQFLNEFESLFNKTGATSAVFSPRQNSQLKTKYNTAILNLKEFFNLGVLNGPDEAILRGVLPDPTNRSAFLTGISGGIYKPSAATRSGIDNMKKMIESSLDERYKSLTSQYGDYSGQSVGSLRDLNRIYVDQKSKINPEIQQLMQDHPELTEDDIISIISQ